MKYLLPTRTKHLPICQFVDLSPSAWHHLGTFQHWPLHFSHVHWMPNSIRLLEVQSWGWNLQMNMSIQIRENNPLEKWSPSSPRALLTPYFWWGSFWWGPLRFPWWLLLVWILRESTNSQAWTSHNAPQIPAPSCCRRSQISWCWPV